ncbi:MAG: MAPEG family protein [Pseudomonadota bacterium]
MTHLPIYTAWLAAFLVVFQVVLMVAVGARRAKGLPIGIGDDRDLERRVRRHGNLAENSGLFLAAIGLLELIAGQTTYVLAIAGGFAFARILHAAGFMSLAGSHGDGEGGNINPFILMRGFGAMGTIAVAFACAGFLIVNLI